jgi:polyisoprenoid-binding protein YceI
MCCLALAVASAATAGGVAAGDEFLVDPSQTFVVLGVKSFGRSYVFGRFNRVQGAFRLDPDPRKCSFRLIIEAGSLDTNDPRRDARWRGPELLQAGQYPLIALQGTAVQVVADEAGTTYRLAGELTMGGATQPVEWVFRKVGEGPGPSGGEFRCGFHGEKLLERSAFGMTLLRGEVGEELALTVSFEGVRQMAAAATPLP